MKAQILAAAFALLTCSCASWFSSGPTPEDVAKSTSELLDSAEKALESLEPEQAESLLAKAKEELARPELAESPLRPPLEARRTELSDRIPGVKKLALVKRLEAAKSALSAAMEKSRAGASEIEQKQPPEAAFDRAREGTAEAKRALDGAKDLEPQDPEYAKSAEESRTELKAIEEKVAAKWAVVEIEVRRTSLLEKTKAVDDAIRSGNAEAVVASSKTLSEAIAKGTELEAKDKNYARAAGGAKDASVRAEVYAHRAQVEAADQAAIAALNALVDRNGMEAAEKAIAALEKTLAEPTEAAKADKRHAGWTAQLAKKAERYQAAVESKRGEIDAIEHKAKVEAAVADVNAQIEGLIDETAARYEKAEAAVSDLAQLIGQGAEIRAKNRGHHNFLAAIERTLDSRRREIRKRRIDTTEALVLTKISELSTEGSFADAEKALRLLENTIDSNAEFLGKETVYARSTAQSKQRVAAHRAAIDGRSLQIEVNKVRAGVDAALKTVEEKMAAAETTESSFTDAGKAIADLEGEIDRASTTKDKAFASYLAELKRKVPGYVAELERRRIALEVEAQGKPAQEAELALDAKMKALEGLPEEPAFKEAEAAVEAVTRAAEKKTPFAEKDRKHMSYMAALLKKAAASTAMIERRRNEVLVQKSRNQIDAAAVALEEALKGTELDAVSGALDALEKAIADGQPAAAKDRTLGNISAAVTKRIARERAVLEAKRTATEIGQHREKVDAAAKNLQDKLDALTDLEPSLYTAAEAAGAALQKAIDEGEPLLEKDKRHAAYLQGLRGLLAKQRLEIEKRRIDAAEAKAMAGLASLKDGQQKQVAEAEVALEMFADTTGSKKWLLEKDPVFARRVKAAELKVQQIRAAIEAKKTELSVAEHRAKVDAGAAAMKEKVASLAEKPDYAQAEDAVKALEAEIARGQELGRKDRRYAAVLAAVAKEAVGQRAQIEKMRDSALVTKHRAKVDEALKAVEAKLGTLTEPTPALYDAAVESVTKLSSVIKEGDEVAAKDRAHANYLSALTGRIPAIGNEIRKRRLDANDAAVQKLIAAIDEKPSDKAFAEAEKALRLFQNTTESSKPFLESDRAYGKHYAQAVRQGAAHGAAIAKKRIDIDVAAHRAQVEPLAQAAVERLNALGGEPKESDFSAALDAVAKLEEIVERGTEQARNERAHASYLAGLRNKIPAFKSGVEKRRIEVAVEQHRKRVDGAAAEVDAALEALKGEPKPADFETASRAAKALEEAIGAEVTKDKKYEGYLAALSRKVAGASFVIERRKAEVEIAAHRTRIDELASAVKEQLDQLSNEAKPNLAAAEQAVKALESAAAEGDALAAKDKKYAAYLAGVKRVIPAHLAAIERKKNERLIQAHEAEVAAADATVNEKLAALTKVDPSLYERAVEAVAALKKVLGEGAELAEKDRGYAARMKAVENKLGGYDLEIRKRRLDANDAAVAEKMQALEGEPKEGDFDAVESALRLYQNTLESNQAALSTNKYYGKAAAAAGQRIASLRRAMEARRISISVQAHAKQVEAASGEATAKIEALSGEPKEADFSAAERAVAALVDSLEPQGEAKNDKKHGEMLAREKKKADAFKAAIARRRVELETAAYRARVDAAIAAVESKLESLESEADFSKAEDAAGELEKVLQDEAKDAKYAAIAGKKVAGYRRAIAGRKLARAVASHRSTVDAATAALDEKLKSLAGENPSFADAEEALQALNFALEAAGEAGKDRGHAKYLAAVKKRAEKAGPAIQLQRAELESAKHRAKVDAAVGEVRKRIDALKSVEPRLYEAAEEAVSALKKAIEDGGELAERDPKYGKLLALLSEGIEGQRLEIKKRRIDAARTATDQALDVLKAEPTDANFATAERALRLFDNTVQSNEKHMANDKVYAKHAAQAAQSVAVYQDRIERRRIELEMDQQRQKIDAAEKAVAEKMSSLEEQRAVSEAERAVTDLLDAVEAGKSLEEKDKKYAAYAASQRKKIDGLKKELERAEFGLEVKPHREKVEAAKEAAEAKLAELGGSATFPPAEEATSELASILDDGEKYGDRNQGYGKYLAAGRNLVARHRKKIERAKVEAAVAEAKEKLDAAVSAADEKMNALEGASEPGVFEAAAGALTELATALGEARSVGDKSFRKRVAALSKSLPERRNTVARARVDGAVRAAEEKIGALDKPDQAAFDAAEEAANAAKAAVDQVGKPRDKKQKKWMAAVQRQTSSLFKRINAKRIGLLVELHRTRVDEALADASQSIEGLSAGPGAYQTAEDAIEQLEKVLSNGDAAKRSKPHAKYLASVSKKIPELRNAIARAKVSGDIASHKKEVEKEHRQVEKSLEALTDVSSPYQAAEDAISSLKQTIDRGAEYSAIDPEYAAFLVRMEKKLPEHRKEIRTRRLSAAETACATAVDGLGEKQTPAAFAEAESAVLLFENTAKSAKSFKEKDKQYEKLVAAAEKKAKSFRGRIGRVRSEIEVEAHHKRVETISSEVSSKMESLESDSAVRDAEEAIKAMRDEIAAGAPIAKKNKSHQKYLAEKKSEASGFEKRLASVSFAREFGPQQSKVDEAKNALVEKMSVLSSEPSDAALEAADAAASDLSVAIADGVSFASRNPRYNKFHLAAKKSLSKARSAIAGEKASMGRAGYRSALEEKTAAVKEKIGGLNEESEGDAFDAASTAVDELAATIKQGGAYTKKDKKLKKELAAKRKSLPRHRSAIQTKKIGALLAQARAKAEAGEADQTDRAIADLNQALDDSKAMAKKDKKLKKLVISSRKEGKKIRSLVGKKAGESLYADHKARVESAKAKVTEAEDPAQQKEALDELLSVIAEGKPLGKKNKGYKKYLAASARQATKQKASIKKRAMAAEVGPHKDQVKEASAELEKAMKAIKRKATAAKVEAAAQAADRLQEVLEEGEPLGKKYVSYKKYLTTRTKKLSLHRKTIKKKSKKKKGGRPLTELLEQPHPPSTFGAVEPRSAAIASRTPESISIGIAS